MELINILFGFIVCIFIGSVFNEIHKIHFPTLTKTAF